MPCQDYDDAGNIVGPKGAAAAAASSGTMKIEMSPEMAAAALAGGCPVVVSAFSVPIHPLATTSLGGRTNDVVAPPFFWLPLQHKGSGAAVSTDDTAATDMNAASALR